MRNIGYLVSTLGLPASLPKIGQSLRGAVRRRRVQGVGPISVMSGYKIFLFEPRSPSSLALPVVLRSKG